MIEEKNNDKSFTYSKAAMSKEEIIEMKLENSKSEMNVRELIIKLLEYNLDAKVGVVTDNKSYPFTITFGGRDGGNKQNADEVDFYVDATCGSEVQVIQSKQKGNK